MPKIIKVTLLLMVLAKMSTPLPFIPSLLTVWTVCMFFILAYFSHKRRMKFDFLLIAFVVVAAFGLMVKNPQSYFRSWERLLIFVLNIALLSPLISNNYAHKIRIDLFAYTFVGLKLIMFASFIAYFLGINLADKDSIDSYWAFSGITNQSMVLAPISAMCLIEGAWYLVTQNINKKTTVYFLTQIICSLWCLMVAGSRGSIIGTVASVIIIFFAYSRRKKSMKYILVVFLSSLFIPQSVIDKAFYTINIKQENNAISASDISSTRDEKWKARIEEFKESPVFGCGFASQTHFTADDSLAYIQETGGLEPGSSWLCILAMTGILGLLTLGSRILKASIKIWGDARENINAIFFLALWIFYLFNGMYEGWVFYSGGFVFYLWWLLFGTMEASSKNNYAIKIIKI